jgi:hypothetical protein
MLARQNSTIWIMPPALILSFIGVFELYQGVSCDMFHAYIHVYMCVCVCICFDQIDPDILFFIFLFPFPLLFLMGLIILFSCMHIRYIDHIYPPITLSFCSSPVSSSNYLLLHSCQFFYVFILGLYSTYERKQDVCFFCVYLILLTLWSTVASIFLQMTNFSPFMTE